MGRSDSTSAASPSAATGCSSSMSEEIARGSRGSDEVMNIQPIVWLVTARSSSQPSDRRGGARSSVPKTAPRMSEPTAALAVASSKRPGDVGCAGGAAQDEEERGVGQRGADPEHDARDRVAAERRPAGETGDEHHPREDHRQGQREPTLGRSEKSTHAAAATKTTWRLPSTVAMPAPDLVDGVGPEHQVDGEEQPGQPAVARARQCRGPSRRCSRKASGTRNGSASAQRKKAVVAAPLAASSTSTPEDEMHSAPMAASSTGRSAVRRRQLSRGASRSTSVTAMVPTMPDDPRTAARDGRWAPPGRAVRSRASCGWG